MRAFWLALAACGPASSPRPPEPTVTAPPPKDAAAAAPADAAPAVSVAPSGQVAILGELPAWAYAIVDGKVAAIDAGFTTASAIDAATGAPAWHVTFEAKAAGLHTLHELPHAFGVWAGPTLHVIDPATGKQLAAGSGPWNGDRCGLDVERGMCAWRCDCGYQVFDCATTAAIGKHYEKTYVEMFPDKGPPSAGCWGSDSWALGRAGNLLVFNTEDIATQPPGASYGMGGGPRITAALDAATGREAWRMTFSMTADPAQRGMSPDHATCWMSAYDGEVEVVDCASGKRLWRLPGGPQPVSFATIAFVAPHALYELRGRRATLYDERTGTRRWRVELPPGTFAWPRGLAPTLDWHASDATAVALLDPATGVVVATIARPKTAGIVPTPTGVILAGDALRAYDTAGTLVATAPLAKARIVLGTDRLLAVTDTAVIVLALPDLHELGRITGSFGEQRIEGPLGAHRAVLFQYDGKTIGRAVLVAL